MKDKGGFTLLEIVITLAVVGGLLVTLIYTLNHHLVIAERHERITIATMLAREKISEMERSPAPAEGEFPEPYSGFFYVTAIRESLHPDMSEIHVSVRSGEEAVNLSVLIETPI